jgi:hypothetical protein
MSGPAVASDFSECPLTPAATPATRSTLEKTSAGNIFMTVSL